MMRQLSEKQVLKKLDIPDFRHLTKEKAVTLVSMLDRVDPRVAMEALKQFPQLVEMLVAEAKEYRKIIFRAFDSNDESNRASMEAINAVIAVLTGELGREDISNDERLNYTEQLVNLARMAADKDTENKKYGIKFATISGGAILGFVGIAAAVLGVNVRVVSSNEDVFDDASNTEV